MPDSAAVTVRPRTRSRVAAALAAVAVSAAGACAAAGGPSSGPTVTVTVTSVEAADGATTAAPAPIPTGTQPTPGPRPTPALPTRLAIGHQRGAPQDYAQAHSRFADAKVDASIQGIFRSPSGNIACDVSNSAAVAQCLLDKGRIKVADRLCPDGKQDRVRGVELTDSGAFPVCHGELAAAKKAPKLPYGSKTVVPNSPFTCLSEEAGVTCIDTDYERGFFIAKNTFVTF